jgi:hypothetical protein
MPTQTTSITIPYSQATQAGKSVAQAVNDVLVALAAMRRVNALLNSISYGSDWTTLATMLGGGLTDAQAQNLWTIISTATAAIDVAQVAALSDLDLGGLVRQRTIQFPLTTL